LLLYTPDLLFVWRSLSMLASSDLGTNLGGSED
jgi:hypothetical protein